MSGLPLPLRLYFAAANLFGPLAYRRISRKLETQGTARHRLRERSGKPTQERPTGRVLWLHAASVGESLSVLGLIQEMGQHHKDLSFLLTSGTASSAQILERRLPPRCQHQFAPLDSKHAVGRFLKYWRPEAAIFVESELWPHMLHLTRQAGIPTALVNARISARSIRNWARAPKTVQHLLAPFSLIHCQDDATVTRLNELGIPHARRGQNLKSGAGPLPFDEQEKSQLEGSIDQRALWLASSTHPGEDEIMIAAHQGLLKAQPDALLILVPRHPERADTIEAMIREAGLTVARRTRQEAIEDSTQVYLADTLGETGLWYALSPVTCLCGSFSPVGGHNPYEPAYAGSAILHGPLYANFTHDYKLLHDHSAALEIPDADGLTENLIHLLPGSDDLTALQAQARSIAQDQTDGLALLCQDLSKALKLG